MNPKQTMISWRIAIASISGLLILLVWLHQETFSYLITLWNDFEHGDNGHGYLVLLISGYLIFHHRHELSTIPPCPSYIGLSALLAITIIWLLGVITDVLIIQTICLVLFLLSICYALLGKHVTRKILFPILFIGFAIPFWHPLTPVLRDLSADIVFRIIRIINIPAYIEGTRIILPAGNLSVTDACSGTRYALPALALGALYGYLNYKTLKARMTVLLVSVIAAIIINILRVFIVVYFAYQTDMQHSFVHDHLALGWYLFAAVVMILLVIDILLSRHFNFATPIRNNRSNNTFNCSKGKLHHFSITTLCAAFIAGGAFCADKIKHRSSIDATQLNYTFQTGTNDWNGPAPSTNNWMPEFRGAINLKKTYQKGNSQVDLYIGYYLDQTNGKELIYYFNRLGNKDIWKSQKPRGQVITTINGKILEQLLEHNNGDHRLVWYWYKVAGHTTTNRYIAKALQIYGLLTDNTQASVTVISVKIDDDISASREILSDFLSSMKLNLVKINDIHQIRNTL